MSASFLPSILTPVIALIVPLVVLISFLRFVDKDIIN